jgi:hypothetical protein
MIELSDKDAICLFRFLKKSETELEECLVPLLTRIERVLYETMSIEEVERLSGYQI